MTKTTTIAIALVLVLVGFTSAQAQQTIYGQATAAQQAPVQTGAPQGTIANQAASTGHTVTAPGTGTVSAPVAGHNTTVYRTVYHVDPATKAAVATQAGQIGQLQQDQARETGERKADHNTAMNAAGNAYNRADQADAHATQAGNRADAAMDKAGWGITGFVVALIAVIIGLLAIVMVFFRPRRDVRNYNNRQIQTQPQLNQGISCPQQGYLIQQQPVHYLPPAQRVIATRNQALVYHDSGLLLHGN